MTFAAIIALALGFGALLLYFLAEAVFDAVFGYIGASTVWLLSFGRVRMDPLRGGESALASGFGVVFTITILSGGCYIYSLVKF